VYTAVATVGAFLILLPTFLALLYYLSRTHTWALPMFSAGHSLDGARPSGPLLALARTCSGLVQLGHTSRLLFGFGLGVLDGIQGVGIGIMLLQTLSRVHVAAALFALQIVGSTTILIAHACAPHSESLRSSPC
jgi:alpha-1,3-glucan synthase